MKCVASIEISLNQLQMRILKRVCIIYLYLLLLLFFILVNIIFEYYTILGVPPSRKDNMKSYLLDNADPIDRSYQSYTSKNTSEVENQVPQVSTRPNSTWEPPRNIFSDL